MTNRNAIIAEDLGSTTLALDAKPHSLRLPTGSAIFAVRGEVWLTQEGMREDVVLAAGARFAVRSDAAIVVSALGGDAVLYVARPADAQAEPAGDLHAYLVGTARRLRNAEIDRAGRALRDRIAHGVRRLRRMLGESRPAPQFAPRLPRAH